VSFEYDHIDIKALATVEREYVDADGHTRVDRYVDRKKLQKLMLQRAQESRRVMEPFRQWLIMARSFAPHKAERRSHMVFIALWETHNRPLEKLTREDISVPRREELRGSLMHFAEWLLESSSDEKDRAWARNILMLLSRLKAIRKRKVKTDQPASDKKPSKKRAKPFTEVQWLDIFDLVESFHKRSGALYPWARPIMRLQLIAGLPFRDEGLLLVERKALLDLVASPKTDQVLVIWSKTHKNRMIPFEFISDEIQDLLSIPASWGVIGDLIGASRDDFEGRLKYAANRLPNVWGKFREWGKASLPGVLDDPALPFRLRITAVKNIWEKTGDLLLVAGMMGVAPISLPTLYPFIAVERKHIEDLKGFWRA